MGEFNIRQMLEEKGFIDEQVSPEIKLIEEINRLKKEKNAALENHETKKVRILRTRINRLKKQTRRMS